MHLFTLPAMISNFGNTIRKDNLFPLFILGGLKTVEIVQEAYFLL